MNKIDKAFGVVDRLVNRKFRTIRHVFRRYFPVMSTAFLVLLMTIFAVRVFYSRPRVVASIIEDDIKLITLALEKIDAKCNILRVEDDYNEIDFLNMEDFTGSQAGPLNLAYADKWEGPYLQVNPMLQEQYYELVRALDGFFVMPGRGVRLPNGLVIGEDFEVNASTNVEPMTEAGGFLHYEGKVFATKLMFKIGDWDTWHFRQETVKKINRMLKEFNEAMPFTCNSHQENNNV